MQMSVFKTSCLQYRISRSRGAEVELYKKKTTPKTFTGKMTHSLGAFVTHPQETGRSAESHRGLRIHPEKKSLCYMSREDWWDHFQAEDQDIKIGLLEDHLYWSVFVCQSHCFKPLSQLKLAKLSHWNGVGSRPYKNLRILRELINSGSDQCGFWLNLTREWTTAECGEPRTDSTQIITIACRCCFTGTRGHFIFLCWGKISRSVRCCSRCSLRTKCVNSASDNL